MFLYVETSFVTGEKSLLYYNSFQIGTNSELLLKTADFVSGKCFGNNVKTKLNSGGRYGS